MDDSYIKDLLLEEPKFKFSEDKKIALFEERGTHLNVKIFASIEEYYFLRLYMDDELSSYSYFGVFKMKSDGYLSELEPHGKNREELNRLTHLFEEEIFDVELLLNEKILVVGIKFLIYTDWESFVYELDDFKNTKFLNNPSDYLI